MSAFDELKKMLGLEMSDQDKADLYNRSGLVPEPPQKMGAYQDSEGKPRLALDPKAMFEASQMLGAAKKEDAFDKDYAAAEAAGTNRPMSEDTKSSMRAAYDSAASGGGAPDGSDKSSMAAPAAADQNAQQMVSARGAAGTLQSARALLKGGQEQEASPALAARRAQAPDTSREHELLGEAFKMAGVNPETTEEPNQPQGQQEDQEMKRRPLGVIGTYETPAAKTQRDVHPGSEDNTQFQVELHNPDRRIFDPGQLTHAGGSNSEQAVAQDKTQANLQGAYDDRSRRIAMADGLDTMASGADIAGGTHYNSPGAYLRQAQAQGNANVERVTKPVEFAQNRQKFSSDMATDEQTRSLRGSAETRAQSAEGRAAAGEHRTQTTFDRTSARSDGSSEVSANRRAEAEALYPQVKTKIPPDVWNRLSADDVDALFKEIGIKDFRTGPSKQGGIDMRQARQMANKAELNDPMMVMNFNDALATLKEGTAPGTGYFMNDGQWSNFLRSPDGIAFRQAVLGIANPYISKVAGKNVTANELERTMTQMGYGSFDDPQSLALGLDRMSKGIEAQQEQKLRQLPPESRQMLEERGAVQHIDASKGKAIKGNAETKYDDSFDIPEKLKPFIGVLGLAKKWLGGGKKGGGGGLSPEATEGVLRAMP